MSLVHYLDLLYLTVVTIATAVSTHGNGQQQTGNNGMWTARLACSASMFIWCCLWWYMSVGEWNGWGRVSEIQIVSNFLCTHWNFSTRHSVSVAMLFCLWEQSRGLDSPVPVAAFQWGVECKNAWIELRFRCSEIWKAPLRISDSLYI